LSYVNMKVEDISPSGSLGGHGGDTLKFRKSVSTVLIATMLYFAPSVIPSVLPARAVFTCGLSWLPTDTAFAAIIAPCPIPGAPIHGFVPAWVWAGLACPASIILSGIVANFRDNRQLTYAEAWTCGLLYWIPNPNQPAQNGRR
jgi:hypothetical protein